MAQGSRPERVGEEIRQEIGLLLSREVHDPGVGFVTITRVKVSPDLQQARVYYTQLGDDRAKNDTVRALERAKPFLRRQIGARVRLRRVPELTFEYDRSIEYQDRVEQLILEINEERQAREQAERDQSGAPSEPANPETQRDDKDGDR